MLAENCSLFNPFSAKLAAMGKEAMHSMFEVLVTRTPDRENCIVELWCGGEHFAELSNEFELAAIEVYPRRDGKPWVLDLSQLQEKLRFAKLELDKNLIR